VPGFRRGCGANQQSRGIEDAASGEEESEIDPDSIYICWMSGSAEVGGQTVSFHEGERLRGDSPAVQGCPQYFVPDGIPEVERPNAFQVIVERNEAVRPPVPDHDALVVLEPAPLQREDVRTLNRAVTVLVGPGQEKKLVTYDKGTVFDARSELCGVLPDAFEPEDSHIQFTRAAKGRRR
jgi:hypothetical protein